MAITEAPKSLLFESCVDNVYCFTEIRASICRNEKLCIIVHWSTFVAESQMCTFFSTLQITACKYYANVFFYPSYLNYRQKRRNSKKMVFEALAIVFPRHNLAKCRPDEFEIRENSTKCCPATKKSDKIALFIEIVVRTPLLRLRPRAEYTFPGASLFSLSQNEVSVFPW